MISKTTLLRAAILAAMATPATVHADASAIEWNGFLNVVGGILTHEPSAAGSTGNQYPVQLGYGEDFTFDQQTSAGLQAYAPLADNLAVTMQLYSEGDIDGYAARLKWLYLTWEASPHSSWRVGRISAPLYYFSDFLNIGYAYHWVTPPEAAYPFDNTLNGLAYTYQQATEHYDWSLEIIGGAGSEYAPNIRSHVSTRNAHGVIFTMTKEGWLTFRALANQFQTTLEVDDLSPENLNLIVEGAVDGALGQSGLPPDLQAAFRPVLVNDTWSKLQSTDALDLDNFKVTYGEIALRAETERWMLMAEVIAILSDSYLSGNTITSFVTGGMRQGNAFYHLTLCSANQEPNEDVLVDRRYALPEVPQISDYSDALASGIRTGLAGAFGRSQQAASVGVSFATTENTALKFEITRIREKATFEADTFGVGYNTLLRTSLNATF